MKVPIVGYHTVRYSRYEGDRFDVRFQGIHVTFTRLTTLHDLQDVERSNGKGYGAFEIGKIRYEVLIKELKWDPYT